MNDREKFCAVLDAQPLLKSDALVVLCGHDAVARADVGAAVMLREGALTLVLSGGRHEPPAITDADSVAGIVLLRRGRPAHDARGCARRGQRDVAQA